MIIGMRGHDFGRMEPRALALAIREAGFEATQLAFAKAFPAPAEQYMTPGALGTAMQASTLVSRCTVSYTHLTLPTKREV